MLKKPLIFIQLSFILGIALLTIPFWKNGGSFFAPIERTLTDLKFKIRGFERPSGEVVIVTFDDKSIEAFGRWKGNRQVVALVLDSIFKLGAKNVAIDILFSEPVPQDNFRADKILQATFRKYEKQLTLTWALGVDGDLILNLPLFSEVVKSQGFINADKESDGVIRKISYLTRDFENPRPSLALAAIAQRTEKAPEEVTKMLSSPINFLGPAKTIPTYSAFDVVLGLEPNLNTQVDLKGKTVFLGVSAFGEVDQVATPFDQASPGVEVHATVADRLLTGRVPWEPNLFTWIVILITSCLIAIVAPNLGNYQMMALFVVGLTTVALGDLIGFKLGIYFRTTPFYLNLAFLTLTSFGFRYYQEFQQKKFLRSAFSKYLAPEVVKSLIANPSALELGGEKKEVSVLFCDIRNFTSISEKSEPSEINQLLNEIFDDLTEIIFKHQGTLDKYIGDALMAFFGAPLEQKDHASRACKSAIEIIETIQNKSSQFRAAYGVEIKVGIGINTGMALVGNLGSKERFNYTAIGDSVNIASRIEAHTKESGVNILTSQATLNSIIASGQPIPRVREVGDVTLKGKSDTVRLFEILS
ncbi:MAG: adenylate/guanylate cyclase domain-containing protein [Deltaproteobacteria bacterium]|nr:adenylate/guanylate cyclase domain-containing protein [Deltaproteobacteria bacterium]